MSSSTSFDASIRARRPSRSALPGPLTKLAADWVAIHAESQAAHPIEAARLSEWRDPWHCRLSFRASDAGGQP